MEDIASATPDQMRILHEEGIRLGISLVEDERPSLLAPFDIQLNKDDFFGDEPFIPDNFFENVPDIAPEPVPRAHPVEPGDPFNPRISSTPLVPNARHNLAILDLSRITELEEQEISDIENGNAKRSSHYTPTARRMINFNVEVPTAGQDEMVLVHQQPQPVQQPELVLQETEVILQKPELVHQESELVHQQPESAQQVLELAQQQPEPPQQPDFMQLRAEAIRRHIVNQPTPSHPRPRRRRRPRPLELWRFPAVEPRLVTEQSLNAFLYPDIPYPNPHIHLRPTAEQQNGIVPDAVEPIIPAEASAASIPQAQHSGSYIQQNPSSISGIPSLINDNLPAIPEISHVEIVPELVSKIIPEAERNMPEIAQLPQDQDQQPSPFSLGPSEREKERAIKITRFLYGQDRDKISMIDFKEEFPTRAEIVGVFHTLLSNLYNSYLFWQILQFGLLCRFQWDPLGAD